MQNKEPSITERRKPKPDPAAHPMNSPGTSLEEAQAEIPTQHCPTYAYTPFETHGNLYCHQYPSLTAKWCPVVSLIFSHHLFGLQQMYPPDSRTITATSLQNKELVLMPCWYVWQTMWNGFGALYLNTGQLPEQACSDDANLFHQHTGNKPIWEPFSKGWFCYFHPQGSAIHREVLCRKRRGGKPQLRLLPLTLQIFWGCQIWL